VLFRSGHGVPTFNLFGVSVVTSSV